MTTHQPRFITAPGSDLGFDDYQDFVDTELLGLLIDDEDNNIGDEAFVRVDAYL